MSPIIRRIVQADCAAWEPLFRAYIDFYKTSLPEEQYQKTFNRLVNPESELYGLVLTEPDDEKKLLAFAHFFPRQTSWSDKKVMHLNDLFVSPECRSRGYGKMMIKEVEKHAREMDCVHLGWSTQHENPARKLYDQLGKCDFVEYRIKF